MLSQITGSRARFAAEALTALASQVRWYCSSYPARIDGLAGPDLARELRRFLANGQTLAGMLDRLLATAKTIPSMACLNLEQIEAQAAAAWQSLEDVRAASAERR